MANAITSLRIICSIAILFCPEKGINALNAAILTINSIQAMRESFPPEEAIRVSYNITEGGHSIGNIPDLAVLEVVIAARSMAALNDLTARIQFAGESAARVLGNTVDVRELDAYLPYVVDDNLAAVIQESASAITNLPTRMRPHDYFSNDLGDVSQKIPTAQVVYGGFYGDLHSAGFRVENEEEAYVLPARVTAGTLLQLLDNNCEKAIAIHQSFRPE